MIETLLNVFLQGLTLWNSKEKTKYVDKILSLKKDWYDEYKKPIGSRDDDKLANIQSELRLTAEAWSSAIESEAAQSK
jgi:hypothetical protein